MNQIKMLLFSSIVMLFTACGGGGGSSSVSSTPTPIDPQAEAISKIMLYADDDTQAAPTILTYETAGVEGVTVDNIDDVNSLVASITASDVDTTEKIQKIVDDLGINILPTADAGPDKNAEVSQAVTITGTANDIDGSIVSYEWAKGTDVLATTASFDYTPTAVGTDTLTLTVMDDDGGTASDNMNVIVTEAPPPNNIPVADAGIDQNAQVGQIITITGSGTDSDGSIVSYEWKNGDTILANSASFNYTPIAEGTDTLTLTVTDNDGGTASDNMNVIVTLADGLYFYEGDRLTSLPSICDGITCVKNVSGTYAGVTLVTHGEYKLVAVGKDYTISNIVQTDLYNHVWVILSGLTDGQVIHAGETVEFSTMSGLTDGLQTKLRWSFNIDGELMFMDTIYFTSNGPLIPPPANQAPIVDAGDDKSVQVNQSVTITGTASDSDGSIASYEWKKGSDTLSTTASFIYTPSVVGSDILTFIATDNLGVSSSDTMIVTVLAAPTENIPPVADDQQLIIEQNTVQNITLSGSDANDDLLDFIVITNPTHGLLSGTPPNLTYTPNTDYTGSDSFTFIVNDGVENSTEATVSISIVSSFSLVKKTGQIISYDIDGNEVNDGSIKDDGYYQTGVTPSYTRDDVKEIVTDHITGLMWQDDSEAVSTRKPWLTQDNYDAGNYDDTSGDTATTYCSTLTLGGYTDWRLPTILALQGITVDSKYSPSIDETAFFNTTTISYVSSTTSIAYPDDYIWTVSFSNAATNYANKTSVLNVRCVRTGQ